jgi:hypothetical protein
LQDRRLVFGEIVAKLLDYERKGVTAVGLLRDGEGSGRMEAWLLFGIVEGEGLDIWVGSFGSGFAVGREDSGCEEYEDYEDGAVEIR